MTHDHRTMATGPMPCHCHILDMRAEGAFLANRYAAALVYALAEQLLATGQPVVLDFDRVEAVTIAYADELVAKLHAQHGNRVRWEGANPEVADAIRTAVDRRATPTPRS